MTLRPEESEGPPPLQEPRYDPLTGALNRPQIGNIAQALLGELDGGPLGVGLILIELSSDRWLVEADPSAAEEAIRATTERLRESISRQGTLGRSAGTEWLALVQVESDDERNPVVRNEDGDPLTLQQLGVKIRKTFHDRPIQVSTGRATVRVQVILGSAWTTRPETSTSTLHAEAERDLWESLGR